MSYSHWREHTSTNRTAKHSGSTTSTNHKSTKVLQNGDKTPGRGTEKTGQNAKKLCAGQGETPVLLTAALWYATRKKPVFPLHSVDEAGRCSCGGKPGCKPGKHPRIRNGHHGASTDPNRIRSWWSQWPDANIGIPTGESSGLLVLDIDDHGSASLEALEAKHGQLPETLTVGTGGGGRHIYFRYRTGSDIRNSTGKVGSGLDVRGEGGYVVAPPSRTDKGPYAFLERKPLATIPRVASGGREKAAQGHYERTQDGGRRSRRPRRGADTIREEGRYPVPYRLLPQGHGMRVRPDTVRAAPSQPGAMLPADRSAPRRHGHPRAREDSRERRLPIPRRRREPGAAARSVEEC